MQYVQQCRMGQARDGLGLCIVILKCVRKLFTKDSVTVVTLLVFICQ